MPLDVMALAHT